MKKRRLLFYPVLFVVLLVSKSAFSQPIPYDAIFVDSMKIWLPKSPDDTSKVNNLANLAGMHLIFDPTLTIKYAKEGAAIAKRIKYHKGRITCLGQSSFSFAVSGEWVKATIDLNEAIPLCEKYYPAAMVYLCNIMVVILAHKGDFGQALKWAQKAARLPTFRNSKEIDKWATYMQLGMMHEKLNNLDSADHYAGIIMHYIKKYSSTRTEITRNSRTFLGDLSLKHKDYNKAIEYYRLAQDHINLAKVYHQIQQSDSAIYYGRIGLSDGRIQNIPTTVQEAAKILAAEYKSSNPAEANKFLSIYIDSRDSLYNTEKLKQLEDIKLNMQKIEYENKINETVTKNRYVFFSLFIVLGSLTVLVLLIWRNNRFKQKANRKLQSAFNNLEATQNQLIQSEKMASLGELTAGIAHEIQNPLNFVNNFSEVNKELISEMNEEIERRNYDEVKTIARDIADNQEKINHHGKRADAIVKGMLQHSRTSSGQKEPTDINALCDEYLRLSYHGLRAKDKSFNAKFVTDLDSSLEKLSVVPQDIGRVVLNLINNAFYAVSEKKKSLDLSGFTGQADYEPTVTVTTRKSGAKVEIHVKDNGNGIPLNVLDKIFQPFFTTKPTGQGTGLGLSLSYDIVKAHSGEIKIVSNEGQGAEFIIQLPLLIS